MNKFYFFTDYDLLNTQTATQAYGPVSTSETTQYRVTSLHSASAAPNAYAVCNSIVFAQKNPDGSINVILKPIQQSSSLAYPVKYFIYKSLLSSSILDSTDEDLIKPPSSSSTESNPPCIFTVIEKSNTYLNLAKDKYNNNPSGTTTTRAGINALGLGSLADSTSANFLSNDRYIDEVFQLTDIDQFPEVKAGAMLGQFTAASFGFEIVLEGLGEGPKMSTVRNPTTIVTCNPAASSDVDLFEEHDKQEEILNYMDPCAFYASFYKTETKKTYTDVQNLVTDIKAYSSSLGAANLSNGNLFNLLQQFNTKNIVYLDIRNEHNHSLNYYKNYSETKTDYATIMVSFDGGVTSTEVPYDYYGWPIVHINTSVFSSQTNKKKAGMVSILLPEGDNALPAVYLAQGLYYGKYPSPISDIIDLTFDGTSGYTNKYVKLAVPKNDATTAIPFYFNLRYLKRIPDDVSTITTTNYTLKAEHYIDNLFELTQLVDSEGPIIPFNNDDLVQWSYTGITVFVDEKAGYGDHYMAKIGIAKDVYSVSFFALDKNENYISGTSKAQNTFQFSMGNSELPVYNPVVTTYTLQDNTTVYIPTYSTIIPDSTLYDVPFSPKQYNGRSLVRLSITNEEFATLQTCMAQLASQYDKRITLLQTSVTTTGGVELYRYEIVLRGYVIGTSDVQSHDVSTGIYIYRKSDDKTRFFYSQKYFEKTNGLTSAEDNAKNFASSFSLTDLMLNVRSSPANKDANGKDIGNILFRTKDKTLFTILGKQEKTYYDGTIYVWYYVEWGDNIRVFKPETYTEVNISELNLSKPRGWIRPNTGDDDKYDRQFYPVAPLEKFIVDLQKFNQYLDDTYGTESIQNRITRLRQHTHTDSLVGKFFDIVIGTSSNISNPEYLNSTTFVYNGGVSELVDEYTLDTNMQLFRDYMGVYVDKDIIIDLHHLFVGLDVLNNPNTNSQSMISELKELFTNPDSILSNLLNDILDFGNNVDTSTWAGDVGSVSADLLCKIDGSYLERYKKENNISTLSETEYETQLFPHYYRTRSGDVDLISDILPHKIHKQQESYLSKNPDFTNIEALLYYYFILIQKEKLVSSFDEFFNYLGLDRTKPFNSSSQEEVYTRVYNAVKLFTNWWLVNDYKKSPLSYVTISDVDLAYWNTISTNNFFKFLEKYK